MVFVAIKTSRAINLLRRLKVVAAYSSTLCSNPLQQAQIQKAADVIQPPHMDGQLKEYSSKIKTLVDEISKLNLIEVSDLNELLRKRLNIKDISTAIGFAPIGGAVSVGSVPTGATKKEEDKNDELPKATKSSFKLKLIKYDESKKVALIKEIKSLVENMNLVQAKKFVESAPQILKNDVTKDDAEKLKIQLEKVGAVIEIE